MRGVRRRLGSRGCWTGGTARRAWSGLRSPCARCAPTGTELFRGDGGGDVGRIRAPPLPLDSRCREAGPQGSADARHARKRTQDSEGSARGADSNASAMSSAPSLHRCPRARAARRTGSSASPAVQGTEILDWTCRTGAQRDPGGGRAVPRCDPLASHGRPRARACRWGPAPGPRQGKGGARVGAHAAPKGPPVLDRRECRRPRRGRHRARRQRVIGARLPQIQGRPPGGDLDAAALLTAARGRDSRRVGSCRCGDAGVERRPRDRLLVGGRASSSCRAQMSGRPPGDGPGAAARIAARAHSEGRRSRTARPNTTTEEAAAHHERAGPTRRKARTRMSKPGGRPRPRMSDQKGREPHHIAQHATEPAPVSTAWQPARPGSRRTAPSGVEENNIF